MAMNYYQLFYSGQLDELVRTALPEIEHDKDAQRAYLRLFMVRDSIYLLSSEAIDMLRREAETGNRYAQYGYARYHVCVRPDENSLWESYRLAEAAMEQGVADAKAMIACTYSYGDIGKVNWEEEDRLLNEAYEEGSELAAMYMAQNLCFGYHYRPACPAEAEKFVDALMEKEEMEGIEPNGWWRYYKGMALGEEEPKKRRIRLYESAAALGIVKAYTQLIIIAGYGPENDLEETDEYRHYLKLGMERQCSGAFYLDAVREMGRYDDLHEQYVEKEIEYDELRACEDAIYGQLSESARLGNASAWEMLGDMYFYGWYNCAQDYKRACTCYSAATNLDSDSAAEKLWRLMHYHHIDRPLEYKDSIALMGARWGSKQLLAETVIAHQEGRLSEYHDEISKYYEPIFDSHEFDLSEYNLSDDDDDPDDDGRYDAWA